MSDFGGLGQVVVGPGVGRVAHTGVVEEGFAWD